MSRDRRLTGRKKRWRDACYTARNSLTIARTSEEHFVRSIELLKDLQQEYVNRLDSLPPNLRNSALARTLTAIRDLPLEHLSQDLKRTLDHLEDALNMVAETELPNAFGKH